jgi:hypothetical protein
MKNQVNFLEIPDDTGLGLMFPVLVKTGNPDIRKAGRPDNRKARQPDK